MRVNAILPPVTESVHDDSLCARCGCIGMTVVTRTSTTDPPRSISICDEDCALQPWACPKCDGRKVPQHTKWCMTEHPEVRAAWESRRKAAVR